MNNDSLVEDEEGLTDKEPAPPTPPPSPHRPYYHPYCNYGKSPLIMRTPSLSVPLVYHLDPSIVVSRPISGRKRKLNLPHELSWLTNLLGKGMDIEDPPRFEIGKSSQAPLHVSLRDDPENNPIHRLMSQGDRLSKRV